MVKRRTVKVILVMLVLSLVIDNFLFASDKEEKRKRELEELQKQFTWWPTDAKPGPVKDPQRGGYWWWPVIPGEIRPWGNRGYVYVYKIIYDYKEEELPPPQPQELRPSLLIKKIIKNVKIYFDFDKADIREDALPILNEALRSLQRNPKADILITGNCDIRGPESYNLKLGRKRAEAVKKYMIEHGIDEKRIKIVSRGKLDAVAPITDLVGMQKDRNAQFMVAEVEEIMLPAPGEIPPSAKPIDETKFLEEEKQVLEGEIKVSTREYTVKKGDTLWKIAERELGSGHRWRYIYELNKERIKDPGRLKPGLKIVIPVE
ncbi:MAG: OmpA family protein [Candidatus Omnitrophota bacterium]